MIDYARQFEMIIWAEMVTSKQQGHDFLKMTEA